MGQGKNSINRKRKRRNKETRQDWERRNPPTGDEFDHFGMDDDEDGWRPWERVVPGDRRRDVPGTT